MKPKIITLILSIFYCSYLITTWLLVNPLNSEYYYKKKLFTEAIEIEPCKAAYHLAYAADLIRHNRRPDALTRQLILTQLTQAVSLKPYSKKYKKIHDTYAPFLTP
jgi:hypothetical protein